MIMEAGFSEMKLSESAYQSNLNSDTYDSMRFVNSHFYRESYDTFSPPPELICLMLKAHSEYPKTFFQKHRNSPGGRSEGQHQSIIWGYMSVGRVQVLQKRSAKLMKT